MCTVDVKNQNVKKQRSDSGEHSLRLTHFSEGY